MKEILFLIACGTDFGCSAAVEEQGSLYAYEFTREECIEAGDAALANDERIELYRCVDKATLKELFPELKTRTIRT